jgi:hypothetical protein
VWGEVVMGVGDTWFHFSEIGSGSRRSSSIQKKKGMINECSAESMAQKTT